MAEELDESTELEKLPPWVPLYLSVWGGTRPDGKRMTVKWAADYAGISPSNVRNLRSRSPGFRRMEGMARFTSIQFAQSYVERGLAHIAPLWLNALITLLAVADSQTVLKVGEWLRGKPEAMDVHLHGAMGLVGAEMSDKDAELIIYNLIVAAQGETGGGGPLAAPESAEGTDVEPPDVDD